MWWVEEAGIKNKDRIMTDLLIYFNILINLVTKPVVEEGQNGES